MRGTKKQDKQGVRTPADIERKYDLGRDFSQIEKLATTANSTAMSAKRIADNAASDVAGLIPAVEKNTADIAELDKKVEKIEVTGGIPGDDGATFTPSVDSDGNLSWTNDQGLPNPATVNIKGAKGNDGYTPVKGVDYFDGQNGKDGAAGKDGVSATHSWNGTTLTITSASGTSAADLKGEKGDKGDTGTFDSSALSAYALKADIATTKSVGSATSATSYFKIGDFGAWGTGNWTAKGFSMLITSRAGEMIWVTVAANDSNTDARAIRLMNRYSKIANVYYSVSESAIYVKCAAWCNNVCAHILSNVYGDYVPTVATVSGLASDCVEINIVEFGINATSAVVGDSSVLLELGGSADRPTYNGNAMALQSDVPNDTNTTYTLTKSGTTITLTGSDGSTTSVTDADTNTVYTHPTSHPASMITGLSTVATSGSYNDLSNKPTIPTAYTHPTSSGNKHIPSGGSSGQILRWSADGTAAWGADNNTTYSAGTGISLSGTTFSNSGVRSVATGSANGTISVNTNGTSANVAVKGLGSAAYTDSSAYAASSHSHSEYLPLSGGTVAGKLAVSGGAYISGRYFGGGDDEGLVIGRASNNYAGLTLGSNAGVRSVMYLMPDDSAVWRYNNGTTSYDIKHPGKAGTIALTSDIPKGGATYTATVSTGWTADSTNGGYYKTVTVSGITASDNPCADVVLGSDIDANALYKKAWALVDRIVTGANSITLYANGDAPATAFTIQLKT